MWGFWSHAGTFVANTNQENYYRSKPGLTNWQSFHLALLIRATPLGACLQLLCKQLCTSVAYYYRFFPLKFGVDEGGAMSIPWGFSGPLSFLLNLLHSSWSRGQGWAWTRCVPHTNQGFPVGDLQGALRCKQDWGSSVIPCLFCSFKGPAVFLVHFLLGGNSCAQFHLKLCKF